MITAIEVLVVLAASAFVVYPLIWGSRSAVAVDEEEQELLSQKERVYTAIKDLDFDYQTGKLTEEDYLSLKDKFKEQAVSLLKEEEKIGGEESLEDEVEKEIKALRKKSSAQEEKKDVLACPRCQTPYSAGDKFCASCGVVLGLICSNCGASHAKGDKFCQSCGQKL